MDSLVSHMLASSETEVALWKERMLAAVAGDGRLLASLVPKLETLIGPQPEVPDLPPMEAQHRMREVFRRFLTVCATAAHPLVSFMDHVQWADSATLSIMQHVITHCMTRHTMVVMAFRDEETPPEHKLWHVISNIRKSVTTLEITLEPLSLQATLHLIADTVLCPPERALPLAELLMEKTAGNPFFVDQFLLALHWHGLFKFDTETTQWTWDVSRIRAANVTNNVIDLMSAHLRTSEPATREALMMAAAIGNDFAIFTLARVLNRSPRQVAQDLAVAIRLGLLLPEPTSGEDVRYRWLHDRVQQAAYHMIPASELSRRHLQIGRTLQEVCRRRLRYCQPP